MTLPSRALVALATFLSVATLLGAFLFQHVGHMVPCELCLTQRWAHLYVIMIGVAWLLDRSRVTGLFGVLFAGNAVFQGGFHAGVERGYWQGPQACSGGGDLTAMDPAALLDQIMAAPVVRCTDIAWEMAGISMAGWNAIVSLAILALWVRAVLPGNPACGLGACPPAEDRYEPPLQS